MSYVFYDVETTGLKTRFDQITQFAAIRTDQDLNVVERFEIRSRLSPHIIPSPGALKVTRGSVASLLDPSLPTQYEMMGRIHSKLSGWPPSAYIGYNSISFDEEILRHSLYQALYPAYLTTSSNNIRADALSLMRVAASLRPDVLKPGIGQQGKPSFRLADLAIANGIEVQRAHEASADVELTRALCNHIKTQADELWSRLMRFGKKSTVEEFITGETAFAFCEIRGNQAQIRLATRFGQHSTQQNVHYALDLTRDPSSLAKLSGEELIGILTERASSLVTIKTNASPSMCPLYECTDEMLGELTADDAERRANALLTDVDLMSRLETAARSLERKWPESTHVEEQLYGGQKITNDDLALQNDFHLAPWADKPKIAARFSELRFKRLAQRILYSNSPEHLSAKARSAVDAEIDRRLREPITAEVPWFTIARAHAELDSLLPECEDELERTSLLTYREYLEERFGPRV